MSGGSGKKSGSTPQPLPAADATKDSSDTDVDLDTSTPGAVTERFELQTRKPQVDVVWIIDNSGSMTGEAMNVQQNFQRWADALNAQLDARVALVSQTCAGGGNRPCVNAPAKIRQLDVSVASTNSLALLAAMSCDVTQTSLGNNGAMVCGVPIDSINGGILGIGRGSVEDSSRVQQSTGRLQTFYREDVQKVFVVVTDDVARGVVAASFDAVMTKLFGASSYALFGFISQGNGGGGGDNECSGTRGEDYITLAGKTGGRTFDICDADWSKNFDALTEGVKATVENDFKLERKPGKILKVALDGAVLAEADYTLSGTTLKLRDGLLDPGASSSLEVEYLP